MVGWREAVVAAAIVAAGCVLSSGPAPAQQGPALPCGGDEMARGIASRVIDGRIFALDDGREVRLAAIEVPPLGPAEASNGEPGGVRARAGLDALVGGDTVVLRKAQYPSDRYGRLVAYAYTERDGDEIFAQGEMIAAGLARVGDWVGNRACAADLLGHERLARSGKLGLWADSDYDVLDAETTSDILAQRGRFALVEGRVVSVRESGATIYVNFGRRWSEGFAVTVLKRNERNFAAAGLDLKGLAGRRIRVRGWIEERGAGRSPWIEAAHPEQIEAADLK